MATLDISALKENCKSSYPFFCRTMQDMEYFDPIHEELCEFVQSVIQESTDTVKLLVIMPRGGLKSTIITKYLPIWLTINDPTFRSYIVSSTLPNASRKIQEIRNVFDYGEIFRAMFPELLPTIKQTWTNLGAEVPRKVAYGENTFECGGIGTRVTGRHFNMLVEDDTLAPDDDASAADGIVIPTLEQVKNAVGWHQQAHALLVPVGGRIRAVVTTRWLDFDLVHYIRENEPDYKVFDVPAEREGKFYFSFYSRDRLDEIKRSVGTYLYSALYLNNPIPAGDRVFKDEWFNEVPRDGLPPIYRYVITVDPAISEKDSACETAIFGCRHADSYIYITDVKHGHFTPSETVEKILELVEQNFECVDCIRVEANAYQKALCYSLREAMKQRRLTKPIIADQTRTSKEVRIQGLQPLFENKQIYFLKGLTPALRSQLLQFPHGRLVDLPDCLSMQLRSFRGGVVTPQKEEDNEAKEGTMGRVLDVLRRKYRKSHGLSGMRLSTGSQSAEYRLARLRV